MVSEMIVWAYSSVVIYLRIRNVSKTFLIMGRLETSLAAVNMVVVLRYGTMEERPIRVPLYDDKVGNEASA